MSALDRRTAGELDRPAGARQLGARKKPIIRLGMGFKDPDRGFPRKTDYFTVRGDRRAAAKFTEVYGETPKAVKIMVPSSLGLALDVSYRSFVGGGDSEDGGRPLALGTNFAPLGYVGGPDVLKVWRQDGTYMEVETEGLDELGKPLDEIAADLKIEIHTTFTFTIPDVLGWGSFAAVTSKGKKSADNLYFALSEIYSAFGAKAPWAFDRQDPPLLVLKPDSALMRFEKDGQASWGKTKIFVLDIVIPEPFEDMRDRLLERQRELAPDGPVAAMYGSDRRALAAGDGFSPDGPLPVPVEEGEDRQRAGADPLRASASAPGTDEDDAPGPADDDAESQARVLADAAALYKPNSSKWPGMALGEILNHGEDGRDYIAWGLKNARKPEFLAALRNLTRVYAPDLYEQAQS